MFTLNFFMLIALSNMNETCLISYHNKFINDSQEDVCVFISFHFIHETCVCVCMLRKIDNKTLIINFNFFFFHKG